MPRVAREQYVPLTEIGDYKRQEVYRRILSLDEPTKVDIKEVSEALKLGHGVVLTLLEFILSDPRVRDELSEMGIADEQLPDWVAAEKK